MIAACREINPELVVQVIITDPLPLPEVCDTVIQGTGEATVQEVLELMLNVFEEAVPTKAKLVGDTLRKGVAPAWSIVTCRVIPPPLMVTVPLRGKVEGLARVEMDKELLLIPALMPGVIQLSLVCTDQ